MRMNRKKRTIVTSEKEKQSIEQYIHDVNTFFEKHPQLRENKGLIKMISHNHQSTSNKVVEKHTDMVLDLTDRWIRYNRFKKKDVYRKVKDDINVSEDTFRRLLSKQRKRYAPSTRMRVAGYFLNSMTFDDFIQEYIKGYEDGLRDTSKPIMEFAEAIKLAVEACNNGYEVSEDHQKDYVDGVKGYEEERMYRERELRLQSIRIRKKIKQKMDKCQNPTKQDCQNCIAREVCDSKK
jgi:hypothetical protein